MKIKKKKTKLFIENLQFNQSLRNFLFFYSKKKRKVLAKRCEKKCKTENL